MSCTLDEVFDENRKKSGMKLQESDYIYATGRIRSKETELLTSQDVSRLISCKTYEETARYLNSKGYNIKGLKYIDALKERENSSWTLMTELIDNIRFLDCFVLKNDFHNLKTGIKAGVAQIDGAGYLTSPSVFNPKTVYESAAKHSFSDLPDILRKAGEESYEVLAKTGQSQLSDAIIDRYCIEAEIQKAEETGCEMFISLSYLDARMKNIKIAYRCALAEKDLNFTTRVLAECEGIDKQSLAKASSEGTDNLLSYLENSGFGDEAAKLKESSASFEKYCDDKIMNLLRTAKTITYGIEPPASFFLAVEAEILTVRIILSGKLNGEDEKKLDERVRVLYEQ